ncbi:MAG: hypothetical protein QG665_269 [Patescibacteria group bacterium]|nr:hypothetical protein [Patescibacteria group bacterium]
METKFLGDGDYSAGVVIGVVIAVFVAIIVFSLGLPQVASDNKLFHDDYVGPEGFSTTTDELVDNDYTPTGDVPTSTVPELQ